MKRVKYIFIALAVAAFAACTPDSHELGQAGLTSEDLVEGIAFSITPDDDNPNIIHLNSLLSSSYTALWETPNGRSKGSSVDVTLPFAGDYDFLFGVITPAGVFYSDTTTITVTTNDFSTVDNDFYNNLTGGIESQKKWVPCDGDDGVGQCTGPIMYCNPDDVLNDGSGVTDLIFESWAPNWDPGFQSWLIPETDPYMDSYMIFSLYSATGCTLEEYRGEDGEKGSSTGTTLSGKYTFNIDDEEHPTLSFTDTYSMHCSSFDDVCENYTSEIKVIELTEYMLQFATMRTNDEGSWWIIWNFIPEDLALGNISVPSDEITSTASVTAIEDQDLATNLFTIITDDATYTATSVTYLFDTDAPYDWYWWNGGSEAWESNGLGSSVDYGTYNWAPAVTSEYEDFALTLTDNGDGTYKFSEEVSGTSGTFTIDGNMLVFSEEFEFFTAEGDVRTVSMVTDTVYVINADPDNNEFYFAVEDGTDASGATNQYLYAFLTQKSIGGSDDSGATYLTILDGTAANVYIETNSGVNYLRVELYNYYGGFYGEELWDVSALKLKKEQTLYITFTLEGITWVDGAAPKAVICENLIGGTWESGCFDLDYAVYLNTTDGGETTVSLPNTSGTKLTFSTDCIVIPIQQEGLVTSPLDDDGVLDVEQITATITSIWTE